MSSFCRRPNLESVGRTYFVVTTCARFCSKSSKLEYIKDRGGESYPHLPLAHSEVVGPSSLALQESSIFQDARTRQGWGAERARSRWDLQGPLVNWDFPVFQTPLFSVLIAIFHCSNCHFPVFQLPFSNDSIAFSRWAILFFECPTLPFPEFELPFSHIPNDFSSDPNAIFQWSICCFKWVNYSFSNLPVSFSQCSNHHFPESQWPFSSFQSPAW